MRESQETEIRGMRVITTQLPARKAYALVPKIGAIVGPSIGTLANLDMGADVSTMGPAIGAFFSALDDQDSETLMLKVLSNTIVIAEGVKYDLSSPDNIDRAFESSFMALFEVLWFVLKVNFSDFFDVASKIQNQNELAEAQKSKSSSKA